jgi:hypothetical protein
MVLNHLWCWLVSCWILTEQVRGLVLTYMDSRPKWPHGPKSAVLQSPIDHLWDFPYRKYRTTKCLGFSFDFRCQTFYVPPVFIPWVFRKFTLIFAGLRTGKYVGQRSWIPLHRPLERGTLLSQCKNILKPLVSYWHSKWKWRRLVFLWSPSFWLHAFFYKAGRSCSVKVAEFRFRPGEVKCLPILL